MQKDSITATDNLRERLARFVPHNSDEVALLGFMIGAAYSLIQCVALDYDDSHSRPQHDAQSRFSEVAKSLATGTDVEKRWLAGYYFNNAVMRLAALNERIDIYRQAPSDIAERIRRANNSLKHEVDAHLYRGWDLTFRETVDEALRLLNLLEERRLDLRALRKSRGTTARSSKE